MNTFNDFLMPDLLGPDSNFIPLFTAEDEDRIRKEKVSDTLPILPLRNTVLFPGMVIPITVGRAKSIKLVQDFSRSEQPIGIVTVANEGVSATIAISRIVHRDTLVDV